MKKIAYIEIDTHAEIANNFRELLKDSSRFSIDYYFSDKILKRNGFTEEEDIIKVNSKNLFFKLSCREYDLVIIGTAHRYFSVFEKIVCYFNTVIIGHNLNFIESSNFKILLNIWRGREFLFKLKLLFVEVLLRKSKVYQKAKRVLVIDESLVKNGYLFLPIFYNCFNGKDDGKTIVIPGSVSQRRRDYRRVMKEISRCRGVLNYNFVFLGKAKGNELRWIERLGEGVHYFRNRVSVSDFDFWMKRAVLLWSPVHREIYFMGIKEIYGESKNPGSIGDAIKYGKR